MSTAKDTAPAAAARIELELEGLSCQGCANKTRRALEQVAGVAAVEVDHAANRAWVTPSDKAPDPAALIQAVEEAGYTARLLHEARSARIDLPVHGMTCGGCANKVKRALEALPAVASAEVDHTRGLARITPANGGPSAESLAKAVEDAGYGTTPEPKAAPAEAAEDSGQETAAPEVGTAQARPETPAQDDGATTTLDLAIDGMTCASCVATVEKALSGVEGVESASVNLANKQARVSARGSSGELASCTEIAWRWSRRWPFRCSASADTCHRCCSSRWRCRCRSWPAGASTRPRGRR